MLRHFFLLIVLLAAVACIQGGGGGGAGSGSILPPPSPSIAVSVSPGSETVLLGGTVSFTASVANSSDNSVSWTVNSISDGSPQVGTITADGVYTAPADLPQGGTVQVTATSTADSSKSGTATVTVHSDIAISIIPATASAELGSVQSFHASITSSGHPDSAIRWSLTGCLPERMWQH